MPDPQDWPACQQQDAAHDHRNGGQRFKGQDALGSRQEHHNKTE